ncbi:MAG: VCBS repeat-containing protein [Planctomycetes bacterium]|nr:VCBS repeat-containing protein [Planctomycetota bacterium]
MSVIAYPPNRPPFFTSEPVVDASVAASFQMVDVPVGEGPVAVAVGDFTGSGNLSLVTANPGDQTVSVAPGPGTKPGLQAVATGDMNGDGKVDVLVANPANGHVKLLLGKGDNSFTRQRDILVGRGPVAIAAGDLTGDGMLSFVTANQFVDTASVLLGNGTGGFTRTDLATGRKPAGVAIGDVFGAALEDIGIGLRDIVVTNQRDNTVSIFPNQGSGAFAGRIDLAVGSAPGGVAIGDVTGDGLCDIVVANRGSHSVSILPGRKIGFGPRIGRDQPRPEPPDAAAQHRRRPLRPAASHSRRPGAHLRHAGRRGPRRRARHGRGQPSGRQGHGGSEPLHRGRAIHLPGHRDRPRPGSVDLHAGRWAGRHDSGSGDGAGYLVANRGAARPEPGNAPGRRLETRTPPRVS